VPGHSCETFLLCRVRRMMTIQCGASPPRRIEHDMMGILITVLKEPRHDGRARSSPRVVVLFISASRLVATGGFLW